MDKMQSREASQISPFISSFYIEDLFGYRSFGVSFSTGKNAVDQKYINIIYAGNGFGKTTVLQFIYRFLSTEDNRGHKSWIAELPFRNAVIELADGQSFQISKEKLVGTYVVQHYNHNVNIGVYTLRSASDGSIKKSLSEGSIERLLETLSRLNIEMYFITDKREYFTSYSSNQLYRLSDQFYPHARGDNDFEELDPRGVRADPLEAEYNRVHYLSAAITELFQRQIITSGAYGQASINSIYLELTKALAIAENNKEAADRSQLFSLIDEINGIKRTTDLFGALPKIELGDYEEILRQAPDATVTQIALALAPFLEGTLARLQAVKPFIVRMNVFINELNEFYQDKRFVFDITNGFTIKSSVGDQNIKLEWLSSGERQLFTIMASVFLAQNSLGIVLIDEPEISLNVIWQRGFVSSLRKIAADAPVQYILASHSLEILNSSDANIVTLD